MAVRCGYVRGRAHSERRASRGFPHATIKVAARALGQRLRADRRDDGYVKERPKVINISGGGPADESRRPLFTN